MKVKIDDIITPPAMMRHTWNEKDMESLAANIRKIGRVINPITIRRTRKGRELVAGFRRMVAAKMAGLKEIDAIQVQISRAEAELWKASENYERSPIDPFDEGSYFLQLAEEYGWNQKQIAEKIGRSEGYISQRVSAMKWIEYLKHAVRDGKVSFSTARVIASCPDLGEQAKILDMAARSGANPAVVGVWVQDAKARIREIEEMSGVVKEPGGDGEYEEPLVRCYTHQGPAELRYTMNMRVCLDCKAGVDAAIEAGAFKEKVEEEGATPAVQDGQQG